MYETNQPRDDNDRGGGGGGNDGDPLAQSFMVDEEGGIFATSVDVSLLLKSSTIPVKSRN